MALSDALAALFGRRRVIMYDVRSVNATVAGMTPNDLYRRQPALRAVVSFLADNVASVPIKCYVREGDADRPRDTTSDLALLLSHPSGGMTTHELMRALVSDWCLYGQALWFRYPDASAPSGWAIRHIPWSWTQAKETWNGFEPSAWTVTNPYTNGHVDLPAEDCIRFFAYDPDGSMESSSAIEALKEVLSEQISAWEFRNGVWRNGGRVTQYLTRPMDAPDWGQGGDSSPRARFIRSWKAKYSGKDGDDTGGTPLLEDGMELKTTTFNAREAEWAEATRLTREDVAAVYHVNPSMIWHSESQTYASAKDNARALYAETLAPIFDMIEERVNAELVPALGLDPTRHYAEFDLSAKLAASFEEQASVLQSAVGGPWMTRNEARARMNLPAIEGGDELIVPLNVTEGGLAAANDTDPTVERYNARPAEPTKTPSESPTSAQLGDKGGCGVIAHNGIDEAESGNSEIRFKSKVSVAAERDLKMVLRAFYERQATSMANTLAGIAYDDIVLSGSSSDIFRSKPRWVRELTEDLTRSCELPATEAARRSLQELGVDPDSLDRDAMGKVVGDLCRGRSFDIVQSTLARLMRDVEELWVQGEEEWTPDAVRGCVQDSYQRLMDSRVDMNSKSLATGTTCAGTVEGARQSGATVEKQWVTGPNARPSHAAMNGQRVPVSGKFSLYGARWPGDSILPDHESCGCNCRIEIVRAGRDRARLTIEEVTNRDDLSDSEKEMLALSLADAEGNLGELEKRMLCKSMRRCFDKAGKQYDKAKTREAYASTVEKLLGAVGDAYGIEIRGEYLDEFATTSAKPKGDEVWAMTQLVDYFPSFRFLGERDRPGNPDFDTDSRVGDIKTCVSARKIRTRLASAVKQCRALPDKEPCAVLSLVDYTGDYDTAISIARDFVDDGSLESVFVVKADGSVQIVK